MSDTTTLVTTKKLYIPTGGYALDKVNDLQKRVGIQGSAGSGKTWAAATFSTNDEASIVFASFDRGLGAHRGRKDIVEVPFYSWEFVDSIAKRIPSKAPFPNKRDAYENWLKDEAMRLGPEQTLVTDALSDIETAFDIQIIEEPINNDYGVRDSYKDWKRKIEYFDRIATIWKGLKCHHILLTHEQDAKDKKGNYTGKVRPLMTGQAADKIVKNFTDWFRQLSGDKKTRDKINDETLKLWGFKSINEYMDMQNMFPGNTIYFWQTEGGEDFDAKCSSLVGAPRFIPATFESFKKYARK